MSEIGRGRLQSKPQEVALFDSSIAARRYDVLPLADNTQLIEPAARPRLEAGLE